MDPKTPAPALSSCCRKKVTYLPNDTAECCPICESCGNGCDVATPEQPGPTLGEVLSLDGAAGSSMRLCPDCGQARPVKEKTCGCKALLTWRPIAGFEGVYEVSNTGFVRRLFATREPRVLTPSLDRYGYHRVHLSHKNKQSNPLVHRVVAEAFIPNPEDKPFVNHKNGCKTHNTVANLEWTTAQENDRHAFDHGLRTGYAGEANAFAVLKEAQVREVHRMNREGKPIALIAASFATTEKYIKKMLKGDVWRLVKLEEENATLAAKLATQDQWMREAREAWRGFIGHVCVGTDICTVENCTHHGSGCKLAALFSVARFPHPHDE